MIKVKVPATCANIGPGFDVLGLALDLYNEIEVYESSQFSISIQGEGKKILPKNESNLIISSFKKIYRGNINNVKFDIKNNIPLARGLGSSASAIIGGLVLGNILEGEPYTKENLLKLAIEIEGHPDNVTPALFGGLTLSYKINNQYKNIKIVPPKFFVYLIIPDFKLSTASMREVLPNMYEREDIVYNLSRISLLMYSFLSKDFSFIFDALSDKVHEPYRGKFIPGYFKLKEELHKKREAACVISGSGPTIACFSDNSNLESRINIIMDQVGISGRLIKTTPSTMGINI